MTVWCGLEKCGIFGPFFFEEGEATATVTSDRYIRMFENCFLPELRRRRIFGDLPWPPRSPDLSMCDFCLWEFLKSRVYAGKPCTLGELKAAIRENIQEIGEKTLVKVEANFRKRLQICARENGHNLSDIIFRS